MKVIYIDILWFLEQNLHVLDQDDTCPPCWSWSQWWYLCLGYHISSFTSNESYICIDYVYSAKSPCSWSRWPLSSMLELESKMILCPGYDISSFQHVWGQKKSFWMVKSMSFPNFYYWKLASGTGVLHRSSGDFGHFSSRALKFMHVASQNTIWSWSQTSNSTFDWISKLAENGIFRR